MYEPGSTLQVVSANNERILLTCHNAILIKPRCIRRRVASFWFMSGINLYIVATMLFIVTLIDRVNVMLLILGHNPSHHVALAVIVS